MDNKIAAWEVVLFLACLIGLGAYAYTHVDWHGMFNPPRLPEHVQKKMNLLRLSNIKLVAIPDEVYDSFKDSPEEAEFFQGNTKVIAAVMPTGCPYRNAFKQSFDQMLSHVNHKKIYRQRIIETGMSTTIWCNGPNVCSKMWLFNNCGDGLCIINPVTHEAIIDNSRDVRQIPFLLTALKDW